MAIFFIIIIKSACCIHYKLHKKKNQTLFISQFNYNLKFSVTVFSLNLNLIFLLQYIFFHTHDSIFIKPYCSSYDRVRVLDCLDIDLFYSYMPNPIRDQNLGMNYYTQTTNQILKHNLIYQWSWQNFTPNPSLMLNV